ncbi:MAG: hypothetical protein JO264_18165 [Acidisphaera sp.]|nr:hypothetical protein [Acidisphaera sp.]
MLKLIFSPRPGGAPDSGAWGNAADRLLDGQGNLIQPMPRPADPYVAPPPAPSAALHAAIGRWVPASRHATVLVHGFDFNPVPDEHPAPADDPFNRVYAMPDHEFPGQPNESWFRFVDPATAIAFAWKSTGSLSDWVEACWSEFYSYALCDLAPLAARALATVLAACRAAGLTVDIVAHSLGSRTSIMAIGALAASMRSAVRRCVFIEGAEYCVDADTVARLVDTQFVSICNRADPVLRDLAGSYGDPQRLPNSIPSMVLGYNGLDRLPNWLDIELDPADPARDAAFRAFFSRYKLQPSGAPFQGRGQHWAAYLWPDNQAMISRLLTDTNFSISELRAQNFPEGVAFATPGRFKGQPVPGQITTCLRRQELEAAESGGGSMA